MDQKILRRSNPPMLCFPKRVLNKTECHGFSVAVPDHPLFYKDQANIVIIGLGEPIFQPQALVTGVHRAALSGALDNLGFKQQIIRVDRVVAVFPIHMDHPEQGC